MKKIVVVLSILMLISVSVYAECNEGIVVNPDYIGANSYMNNFSIDNTGRATMDGKLYPKSSNVMDKVSISFRLINSSSETVFNTTVTVLNKTNGAYCAVRTFNVENRGIYKLKVTYKCYKNGVLLETISTPYISKQY